MRILLIALLAVGCSGAPQMNVGDMGGGGGSGGGPDMAGIVVASGLNLLAGALGGPGNLDGTGASARIGGSGDAVLDGAGNLYVVDGYFHRLSKVALATGQVTTVAAPNIGSVGGLAADASGVLYLSDPASNAIESFDPANGTRTTIAGGTQGSADGVGGTASFSGPARMALDASGNLYVDDSENYTIRKIALASKTVTTFAGTVGVSGAADGVGTAAKFGGIGALALADATHLYVADAVNNTIRVVDLSTAGVTTIAGAAGMKGNVDAVGGAARFNNPIGICFDGVGSLYVTDQVNETIRKIVIGTATVSTVAGQAGVNGPLDGAGTAASFELPHSITSDRAGNFFITDTYAVRKLVAATATVSTVAGAGLHAGSMDGVGAAAWFNDPRNAALDGSGSLYVADNFNNVIRKVVVATGETTTVAGSAGVPGSADGVGAAARFHGPYGVALDGAGNLYISDAANFTIRKMVLATDAVTTIAGSPAASGTTDGVGSAARFSLPRGIAIDAAGNLYVADYFSGTIRKIDLATTTVSTIAAVAGANSVAADHQGNLFVAPLRTSIILKIELATGSVSNFIGMNSTFAATIAAEGVATDSQDNVYIADSGYHAIRKLERATGMITTIVGDISRQGISPGALPATLNQPNAVVVAPSGALLILDRAENAVLTAQ